MVESKSALLFAILAPLGCFLPGLKLAAAEPVRLIFDTDMDSDCDDAGALAAVHALADRGEARILATMVSSYHPWSASCVDAINTYFRRPDLPIGASKGGGKDWQGSRYARQISETFPHDSPSYNELPDANAIYRQVLADSPDRSVVIVTVGDLTNIARLLETKPDAISPLGGPALVKQKVKRWVCMGRAISREQEHRPLGELQSPPRGDGPSGSQLANRAHVHRRRGVCRVTSNGAAALLNASVDNPVRMVYEIYFGGKVKHRHSADQIAVLVAVRGIGKPWAVVSEGHNHIFPKGTHQWRKSPDNEYHSYISALAEGVQPNDVAREIEGLMLHSPMP